MIYALYNKMLENSRVIVFLFCALCILGIVSAFHLRLVSPKQDGKPVLTIITDYTGMDPETIEQVVTVPIERVLKNIPGIDTIDSSSIKGKSMMNISLNPGIDVDGEAVLIMDHVYHISRNFPREVGKPALYRYNTNDRPAIIISLEGKGQSDAALYRLAHTRVREELLSVDGIAQVELTGPGREVYFIVEDYENMSRMMANFDTLFNSIVSGNLFLPLGEVENGTGLDVIDFPNRYTNLFTAPTNLIQVGSDVVSGADLFFVEKSKKGDAPLSFVNNRPELVLSLFKKNYSGILRVDRETRRLLQKWEDSFSYTILYNQADGFRIQRKELLTAAAISFGSIVLLLLLMYRNIFFALCTAISIMIFISGMIVFIAVFRRELDTVTLVLLIYGSGVCAGGSVIVIDTIQKALRVMPQKKIQFTDTMRRTRIIDNTEATYRHTSRSGEYCFNHRQGDNGFNNSAVRSCISTAMVSIRRPLFSMVLAVFVLFVPFFSRTETNTTVFTDFVCTTSIMAVFSFLINVFFIPPLFTLFLQKMYSGFLKKGPPVLQSRNKTAGKKGGLAGRCFFAVMRWLLKRPLAGSLLIVPGLICTVLFFTNEYTDVSLVSRTGYVFTYTFDPGYNSGYRKKAVVAIGDALLQTGIPINLVTKLEGDRVTFYIDFPFRYGKQAKYGGEIEKLKSYVSSVQRDDGFFDFSEDKGNASTRILFFGDDISRLNSLVDKAVKDIVRWEGVEQVLKGYRAGEPEIVIVPDTRKMHYYGLDVSGIVRFLRYIFYGPVVMKHYEAEGMTDVHAQIEVEGLNRQSLRALHIPGSVGGASLADFCTLEYRESPSVITRKNGKRFISLVVNHSSMQDKIFKNKIRSSFRKIAFPVDFYWAFDDHVTGAQDKRYSVVLLVLILFIIYTILGILFKSYSLPVIGVGGVFSLFIGVQAFMAATGYSRSVPVRMGLMYCICIWLSIIVIILNEVHPPVSRTGVRVKAGVRRVEPDILLAFRKKILVITCMALIPVIPALAVYFLTSTQFYRVLSGVIVWGTVAGIPFAFISTLILYRACTTHFKKY